MRTSTDHLRPSSTGGRLSITIVLAAVLCLGLASRRGVADDAPGAPGSPSVWAPAAKEFLGTSATNTSRVYFTGAEGIVTKVFYPTLDRVQNVDLQFLVTDTNGTWGAEEAEERQQDQRDVSLVNKRALLWQVITTADNGKWKLLKKVFTDAGRSSLVQRITFQTLEQGKTVQDYRVYVLNNPAINNSGGGDNSRTLS